MGKKSRLLLGAHVSIAGGLYKAIERGQSIGCTTIQIFTKSNRQWRAKKLTDEDIKNFKSAQQQSDVKSVVAHASYLINLAAINTEVREKSIYALIEELQRCDALAIPYLVLHPGSSTNGSDKAGLDKIIDALNIIFSKHTIKTTLLLETMAGQGSSLGSTFEQIAYIYKKSKVKKHLGVCIDTCHIFAAGYDFRTKDNYEKTWNEFDKVIGLNLLKVIHINDSKKDYASKVDRHANIGKGNIGLEGFRLLFNDKRFFAIPKILETPDGTLPEFAKDIATIKSLLSPKTKHLLEI